MSIGIKALSYVDKLKFISVGLFKSSSNSAAFGLIEIVVLNNHIAFFWFQIGNDITDGFVDIGIDVKELIDFLFA